MKLIAAPEPWGSASEPIDGLIDSSEKVLKGEPIVDRIHALKVLADRATVSL
jgi:hypothetical protein